MRSAPLLIAILASPFFFPVSCTSLMIPAARQLSVLGTRDLQAGAAPYLPMRVPVMERGAAAPFAVVAAEDLPKLLAEHDVLTSRLSPAGATAERFAGRAERYEWRAVSDGADQVIELERGNLRHTHTLRYRATATGIVPLTSRELTLRHVFEGGAIGAVLAALLLFVARFVRDRGRRKPAP